jgi:putative ABC transport system permease protein
LLDLTERAPAFIAALRDAFATTGLQLTPWNDLADFYNKTEALFSRQMIVVKWMIAVILVLSISNTLTMSVMERTAEIGTAMAIGVRRAGILRLFLIEGVLIGIVSGILGIVIGGSLSELISYIGIPMPPAPGMSEGYTGHIRFSMDLAIDGVLLAVLSTLLASLVPAWKASRMIIVDTLRHNR